MKQFLLASLLTISFGLGVQHPGFSQKSVANLSEKPVSARLTRGLDLGNVDASTRAMDDFSKRFIKPKNEKWYRSENSYTIWFDSDDIRYRVIYDNKGKWLYTEKGYTGSRLPRNVRRMVKASFLDYEITWVTEYTMRGAVPGPVYFVHIESPDSFKNLVVFDDEIAIREEFEKAQ